MCESPVQNLEKALGPRLIWTGAVTFLSHFNMHMEFNAYKDDDA